MKRSELLFSTLLLPVDAVAIFGAFMVAYYVRIESGVLPVSSMLPLSRFAQIAFLITVAWLVIFALCGLYSLRSTRRGLSEFSRIAAAITIGMLTVIAVIFFWRVEFFSRLVIVFAFIASLITVSLARAGVRLLQRSFFRYGIGVRRAVIVGTGPQAQLIAHLLTSGNRGYRVLGLIEPRHRAKRRSTRGQQRRGSPTLGILDDVKALLARLRPDELIAAEPTLPDADRLELIQLAEDHGTEFRYLSNLTELETSKVAVSALGGIPIMTVQHTPLDGWGRVLKRVMDLVLSVLALPMVLLVYVVIVLLIKFDSPGPVMFKHVRVGRNGKEFTCYKFRSMVADAESRLPALRARNEVSGPVFKMRNDPRVTSAGKWLRQTSLDELPQVFNVLRGQMSLVGPRPPLPDEVAQYDRAQRRRLTIKPGITGPWQVSGRSNIGFDEWVRLDVYYIQNWSLLLDLTILFKTIWVVLRRQGAY